MPTSTSNPRDEPNAARRLARASPKTQAASQAASLAGFNLPGTSPIFNAAGVANPFAFFGPAVGLAFANAVFGESGRGDFDVANDLNQSFGNEFSSGASPADTILRDLPQAFQNPAVLRELSPAALQFIEGNTPMLLDAQRRLGGRGCLSPEQSSAFMEALTGAGVSSITRDRFNEQGNPLAGGGIGRPLSAGVLGAERSANAARDFAIGRGSPERAETRGQRAFDMTFRAQAPSGGNQRLGR